MTSTPFVLSAQQQEAKDKFRIWWDKCMEAKQNDTPIPPPFRLFGYAGTGKSTAAKSIIGDLRKPSSFSDAFLPARTMYGSYTGKSCLVMTKNDMPAKTIHSTIYKPVAPSKEGSEKIKKEMDEEQDDTKKNELRKQYNDSLKMRFELNEESELHDADLFTIDEVSFVNKEMRTDIEYFGVPLFVLGDPGQLPPVEGTGAFIGGTPDAMLTDIHRQALDNPIILFSMKARMGVPLQKGDFGALKIKDKRQTDVSTLMNADQILAGKNDTRRNINKLIRRGKNLNDIYPVEGEKLICLKNSKKHGIFNGSICYVKKRLDDYADYIEYEVELEDNSRVLQVRVHKGHFDEYITPGRLKELKWWDFQDTEEFDFGYCITVHKSQGSQYNNVVLVDDGMFNWGLQYKETRKQWLYTGITRAAETLVILQ